MNVDGMPLEADHTLARTRADRLMLATCNRSRGAGRTARTVTDEAHWNEVLQQPVPEWSTRDWTGGARTGPAMTPLPETLGALPVSTPAAQWTAPHESTRHEREPRLVRCRGRRRPEPQPSAQAGRWLPEWPACGYSWRSTVTAARRRPAPRATRRVLDLADGNPLAVDLG